MGYLGLALHNARSRFLVSLSLPETPFLLKQLRARRAVCPDILALWGASCRHVVGPVDGRLTPRIVFDGLSRGSGRPIIISHDAHAPPPAPL